ncbi:MAG: hypothetical protein ABSH44_06775 [Bryobacteraceae bacterium]|jgi:hypothetical protein
MRFAIQLCGVLIGLPLELLIIAAMLRGGYRRFPLIFVYTIADFLTTVVELPSGLGYVRSMPWSADAYAAVYWLDEGILQVLVYAVVMSLIYQATGRLRPRRIVRASLIAGAILFAGISFLIHWNPALNTGSFMTPWTRDLNFCSAILDLALWALLIASREKDHRLLLLSGGLGILFTGEAIGESARELAMRSHSRPISLLGNSLIMLTNLLFLYIWWQALRRAPVREADPVKGRRPHD